MWSGRNQNSIFNHYLLWTAMIYTLLYEKKRQPATKSRIASCERRDTRLILKLTKKTEMALYLVVTNWFKLMLCGNKNDLHQYDHMKQWSALSVLFHWDCQQLNKCQVTTTSTTKHCYRINECNQCHTLALVVQNH